MHLLGRDPLRIIQRTERTESLTQENIHAALRKYFPLERYTVVTLMPEKPHANTEQQGSEARSTGAALPPSPRLLRTGAESIG